MLSLSECALIRAQEYANDRETSTSYDGGGKKGDALSILMK